MSMTLDVGDDRDDEIDEIDDADRDDDDDEKGDDGRSPRGSGRRAPKRKDADDTDDDEEDDLDDLDEDGLRAELKKARAALSRAGKQTARQRAARKALEKRISTIEGDLDDDDEPDEDDDKGKDKTPTAKTVQRAADRARKQARREADEEHRKDLINLRAESALERAGVSPRNVRLVMRELDYDQVDFDAKSRAVDGLDDEIDRLKDEFPDLFRRPRGDRRRINGGDDRDGRLKRRKPMTATEIQAAQLRGR